MASRFELLSLIIFLIQNMFGSAVAGSIAAWLTGLGAPQIIMQDDTTGKIFYSLCNSNGSAPIFPANASASFEIDSIYAPKNGTSLAGTGWVDANENVAAIWFQREDDQLVFHLWKCNATGHFNLYDNFSQRIIGSGQSVHPRTGLMALNLGQIPGYRVYYQDETKETLVLTYNPETSTWDTQGTVSRDAIEGFPISAGFIDMNMITVVTPRDKNNIEVSTQRKDGKWTVTSFPTAVMEVRITDPRNVVIDTIIEATNDTRPADFLIDPEITLGWSLEAWDGGANGIGLTLDDDATRNIYYIGNDSLLHRLVEVQGTWQKSTSQEERIWPRADVPNAQFAIASDYRRNEVFIYYMSNGQIIQLHQSAKNEWDPATPLAKYNNTALEESDVNDGLSGAAKAGIGVGVGVGSLAFILIALTVVIRRRRRREDNKQNESQAEPVTGDENKPPPPQLVYYEMPTQEHSHEVPSHHGVQEMEGYDDAPEMPTDNHSEEMTPARHDEPTKASP
ncbi:hypothetical protein F5Y05DRAFT_418872 [Hypoxylon sp. FL0543]|nr:hypothetical protein F5Y05DRAFT_418872 [Hypoxylon sp. FL0543]